MPIARPIVARYLAILIAILAPPAIARSARAGEVLHFDLKTLDLGPIGDDEHVFHAFPFTNATQRTVRIAMSYCHFCAAPILDKGVLGPGESATVVLELDPTGKRGPYAASVAVSEEGRPDTAVDVTLKGDICPRVWVEPTSMFPHLVRGREFSSSFAVIGRAKGFSIENATSDLPGAGIDIGPPAEVADCGDKARRQEITVRFPTDMPLGRFGATIHLTSNDPQARPQPVTIDGVVTGRLSYEPTTLGARLVPDEPFVKSFEVVADSGPLVLSSIDIESRDEARDLALDAVPTADPNRRRVTISGRAPLRERETVTIRVRITGTTLSEPGEESLTVPITLIVFGKR